MNPLFVDFNILKEKIYPRTHRNLCRSFVKIDSSSVLLTSWITLALVFHLSSSLWCMFASSFCALQSCVPSALRIVCWHVQVYQLMTLNSNKPHAAHPPTALSTLALAASKPLLNSPLLCACLTSKCSFSKSFALVNSGS